MSTSPDLSRLADFFPAADIEWKPGATTRDKKKGLAMAYITNRAIMQRLDDVCGPAGWRNEFREGPGGGVLCGLSILCEMPDGSREWVTKWDGADNSAVEAVKGGLSDSMKRAGYQWGIGRYLYKLDSQWVRLDDRGRFAETPRIPSQFLPREGPRRAGHGRAAVQGDGGPGLPPESEPERPTLTTAQAEVVQALRASGVADDRQRVANILGHHGCERISELSDGAAQEIVEGLAGLIA